MAFMSVYDNPEHAFASVDRLNQALAVAELPCYDSEELYDLLGEYLGATSFRYAWSLMHQPHGPTWHYIELGEGAGPMRGDFDPISAAETLEFALAACLERMDSLRICCSGGMIRPSGVIELYGEAGTIARIGPIRFSGVNPEHQNKAFHALEGCCTHGDTMRAQHRLQKSLSGLSRFSSERHDPIQVAIGGPAVITTNSLAARLRFMISESRGRDIKLSQAQELVARLFGASDWQQFRANERPSVCRLGPVMLAWGDGLSQCEFYRTVPDGVVAFAARFQQIENPGHCHLDLNGAYTSSQSIQMSADYGDDSTISLHGVSELTVESSDYLVLARSLIRSGRSFGEQLAAAYCHAGEAVDAWASMNERLGIAKENQLVVGSSLFSIREAEDSSRAKLIVEDSRTFRAGAPGQAMIVYRAEVYWRNGVVEIEGDYDHDEVTCHFQGWTEQEYLLLADLMKRPMADNSVRSFMKPLRRKEY